MLACCLSSTDTGKTAICCEVLVVEQLRSKAMCRDTRAEVRMDFSSFLDIIYGQHLSLVWFAKEMYFDCSTLLPNRYCSAGFSKLKTEFLLSQVFSGVSASATGVIIKNLESHTQQCDTHIGKRNRFSH